MQDECWRKDVNGYIFAKQKKRKRKSNTKGPFSELLTPDGEEKQEDDFDPKTRMKFVNSIDPTFD
jgi:hypothetical protein